MTTRTKTTLKASALVAAALLATGVGMTAKPVTAEAKPKVNFSLHIGHSGYYGGPRYYGGGYAFRRCRWLRRRAIHTGHPRWWRRYRRCMWRHGY
jgi:hypothetical protein